MHNKELQPEVIVFAGSNGSGKSTITRMWENDYWNNESISKLTGVDF